MEHQGFYANSMVKRFTRPLTANSPVAAVVELKNI
jgi:hypothetical protein